MGLKGDMMHRRFARFVLHAQGSCRLGYSVFKSKRTGFPQIGDFETKCMVALLRLSPDP